MSKAKIIDVAEAAGVSKSTVSQFLNGRFNFMSKDTKVRIEKAISELNYVPNSIARSLKTDKTNTIGVIVRDITGPYTSSAIRGMDDWCKKSGYNLIIYNTDFDAATEAKALTALTQLRVDGIIVVPSGANTQQINETIEQGTPIVQFQLERENTTGSMIVSDYKQGSFDATEYLIKLGHQRICFLSQKFEHIKSREERYQGYTRALEEYGINLDTRLVQYWHRVNGFENAPSEILKMPQPPTAFFAQHLAITTDLLKDLGKDKINIPNDVSVIGFDELPMADFFKVPITVVKQSLYEVGEESAKLLIEKLENNNTQDQRILIPCSLIKRNSCKSLIKN